jgi:hypothetical protein
MLGASLLFAVMGVCVKYASADYSAGEIVLYRSVLGLLLMLGACVGSASAGARPCPDAPGPLRGRHHGTLPVVLFDRRAAAGHRDDAELHVIGVDRAVSCWAAPCCWGPLRSRPDYRLVLAVMAGFAGVALILRPTIEQDQLWHGLMGLLSGCCRHAYLQVTALGRVGEPGERVVFYFSASGIVFGAVLTLLLGGPHGHSPRGVALLLTIGADRHRGAVDDDPRLRHRCHAGHCRAAVHGHRVRLRLWRLAVR